MNFRKFRNHILNFKNFSPDELELIKKAYLWVKEINSGFHSVNGEPYFNHCLRTAFNLARLKMDSQSIIAAILYDSLNNTSLTIEEIKNRFGGEIARLVEGVTKISNYKYEERNILQAENLKKLILSIIEDPRVAIIKLADRLETMKTLKFLPEEKRKKIALETIDVYVPLAIRLGINEWAGELDDLALKYLEPEKYKWLVKKIKQKISAGKFYLEKIKSVLEIELTKNKIQVLDIAYRVKRIASISKKLQRKNFDLNQIYDLLALRILVKKTEECYLTLGIVHSLFKPLMHEFDDYIAFPKPNGYRGLHTTVIDNKGNFLEIQIKTEEMHYHNEYGAAAYFAYAESKQTKNYIKEKSVIANTEDIKNSLRLKNWQENLHEAIGEKIYVLTPKGDVIDLPNGSTPLDFAYKIHTNLGHHFAGARVNQKIVSLDYKLNNGDLIEIITNKNKKPSRDWLNIVKSTKAKKKIRTFLNKYKSNNILNQTYKINIIAKDRIGLLKDISDIISSKKLNIIDSKTKVKKHLSHLSFLIKAKNKTDIINLKQLIKNKIKEIIEIK